MNQFLDARLASDVLPSTLLLIGGTLSQAKELVKKILGPLHAPKIDSDNHPDLHIYLPEGKSQLHPIASIQQLIQEMAYPPFEAPRKIFILADAEKMLPSASNALLKTLEEPPSDTTIILLCKDSDQLLPTIRSRCTPFALQAASTPSDWKIHLRELIASKDPADLLKKLGTLTDKLQDEEADSLFEALLELGRDGECKLPFDKLSDAVEKGRLALQHNVKLRNIVLQFFLLFDCQDKIS